jgi:tellurite resistance protein
MSILLILAAIVVVASLAVAFFSLFTRAGISELINRLKRLILSFSRQKDTDKSNESSTQLDLNVLNCRAQLIKQEGNNETEIFQVEICGTIHAPDDRPETCHANLKISILDITDGVAKAQTVKTRAKDEAALNRAVRTAFCYNTDLGKLPHQVTTLSEWTVVAKLPRDWLMLPRKGQRKLQFETSALDADNGQELACAKSILMYESQTPGYIDIRENIERAKALTVALAFTISAADGKLYDCEIKMIKNWARRNLLDNEEQASDKGKRKLDKALNETITFFREGYHLDTYQICREVAEIAPAAQRYDILDLCLHVAQVNGSVSADEISLLKNMADWLDIDADRFRLMMEKILPIDMHEIKDIDTILGITSDMSNEKARKHLNKEYSKWNSRVTNSDPHVQSQADQMLRLIAEARYQYISK